MSGFIDGTRERWCDEEEKLSAKVGSLALVTWPEVTSWNLAGWQAVQSIDNKAVLRKVR